MKRGEPATSGRYEVQGRRIERQAGTIIRDETRLATAGSLDAAITTAREFVAGGMATWVYSVHLEPGRATPTYRTVAHLEPSTPPVARKVPR